MEKSTRRIYCIGDAMFCNFDEIVELIKNGVSIQGGLLPMLLVDEVRTHHQHELMHGFNFKINDKSFILEGELCITNRHVVNGCLKVFKFHSEAGWLPEWIGKEEFSPSDWRKLLATPMPKWATSGMIQNRRVYYVQKNGIMQGKTRNTCNIGYIRK